MLMFGTRYMAMLLRLRLLLAPGRRLPRRLSRRRAVRGLWQLRPRLVALGRARHRLGRDQPADRGAAGRARRAGAGRVAEGLRTRRRKRNPSAGGCRRLGLSASGGPTGSTAWARSRRSWSRRARAGRRRPCKDFDESDLMDGDVTVRVTHSTVNYKDGLAITGKAPVVRRFPMIPGIDFAGTVESSSHPDFKPRRRGRAQRLGHRRDASRRLWREGARQGRLAGAACPKG